MRQIFCKVLWRLHAIVTVVIFLGGCASLVSTADPTMIISNSPWKQRPGTAGAVGPQPIPNPQDTRFKGISGQFVADEAHLDSGTGEDWVTFDGDGNFRCGPRFHPLAEGMRPPLGKGYLQGFYMFDGQVVHLAFCQGAFRKATVIHKPVAPGVERLQFNDKTYTVAADRLPDARQRF
ncbi:MAG: hypothetical protein P8010_19480 [Desulfosarcinaceae bacterium]|jgi:hypothetical protein